MIKTAVHLTFSISCILVFDTRNIGATVLLHLLYFLLHVLHIVSKEIAIYLHIQQYTLNIYLIIPTISSKFPFLFVTRRFCVVI